MPANNGMQPNELIRSETMPIPNSEEQRYSRASPRLLALGWPQLAVVVAGVVLILGVAAVFAYPELYVRYIQMVGIREFEAQYEFRSGDVLVKQVGQQTRTEWGIVWVAPAGTFARLGVRPGDIPFEYHGGVRDMYFALQQASVGEASSFQVYTAADSHLEQKALREIHLPPAVRSAP
jgi:hypothetical protein